MLPDRTCDHRLVIDAIAFKYRPGQAVDGPARVLRLAEVRPQPAGEVGRRQHPREALHLPARPSRHRRQPRLDRRGRLSTIAWAHQHAAGARQKGPRPTSPTTVPSHGSAAGRPPRPASPRTATADRSPLCSRPAKPGTHPPSPRSWPAHGFRPVGRPRTTPEAVLADKAYSSRAIRTHLRQAWDPGGDPAALRPERHTPRRGTPAARVAFAGGGRAGVSHTTLSSRLEFQRWLPVSGNDHTLSQLPCSVTPLSRTAGN